MIEKIAPDFYRVQIPLSDVHLKTVNSYVIRDGERSLIIDTGMHNQGCFHAMQSALKRLDVELKKTDFFITHCHGDHIGLLNRLIGEESIVYVNKLDAQVLSKIKTGIILSEIRAFLQMSGFPEKDPEKILPRRVKEEFTFGDTLPFKFIDDSDIIEKGKYRFTCVTTPGHSRGHTCLYEAEKKIFIAGDHILKDITPGIQGRIDGENPLRDFLFSLDKVYALDIDRVLPGHRATFGNCKARIEEIKEHHDQRNREVLAILGQGSRNIYEVASRMTWNIDSDSWDSFPVVQSFFATGEAFAHLRYLEEDGLVTRKAEGQIAKYQISTI